MLQKFAFIKYFLTVMIVAAICSCLLFLDLIGKFREKSGNLFCLESIHPLAHFISK